MSGHTDFDVFASLADAPRVEFAVVDVFADRPLTGNPLAVVPDADRLTVAQMTAIAREFNQSETTFLLHSEAPGADQRLRSFTAAGHEVLGAGHNALGAWLWLALTGRVSPGAHRQQIGTDVLDVEVTSEPRDRFRVTMAQSAPQFGAVAHNRSEIAGALGLDAADLDPTLQIQAVSTGVSHLMVPLTNQDAVDRTAVDAPALRDLLAAAGGEGCYVYTAATGPASPNTPDTHAYARFFNPTVGIVEDPATGTAAGPLAALLVHHNRVPDRHTVHIEQGHALGRPSRLNVHVNGPAIQLSGSGLIVATGQIAY